MADRQSGGDNTLTRSSRQRFSLISLFAGNQSSSRSSFRERRQHSSKKSKSKSSADSQLSTTPAAPPVDTEAIPQARTRLDSITGFQLRECPLCYDEIAEDSYPELSLVCGHKSCAGCLKEYLKIEIGESRVDISCPECKEKLHPADIQQLLKEDTACMSKYEEFMVRRVLVTDPDTRWCPAPDCGYAVIATGCASCPMLKCQRSGCGTAFCYHCKMEWHANKTCDAARLERFPIMTLSISDVRSLSRAADEYKACPRCKTMINKMDDGSCNHMTCSMCGAQFCWLCLKEASDLHYLSPSGCTFWGKEPWSKKKKILLQLGTLIGAPVGIALIATLSVPVFIFGLPVFTAKKIYQRCKKFNKHKRNAAILFGTIGAFLASPLVAGFTIAIGVPVMLSYVYGVVPYSLCRGGTYGVKNDGGTFSFDFGGSNDETAARGNDGGYLVANPSIGPGSIGENSLGAGFALSASGVQMDRVGLPDDQSDTKSASMKNMVGTSITGSLYEHDNAAHQKLEIRADVSLRPAATGVERKSSIDSQILSQADSRSLRSFGPADDRSHVSFNIDNASMKALAGSICTQRDRDGTVSQDLPVTSDVPNKSCMKVDHGSPVSNRSVSFATHDKKTKPKKKQLSKRRRDAEAERLSLASCDAVSNSSSGDTIPVSKRCSEYKPRVTDMGQRGVTDIGQRGVTDMGQHGVTELASRGVFEIIQRAGSDYNHTEGSGATAVCEMTTVEVDKPHLFVASAIKQSGPSGDVPAASTSASKALSNIQEDNGHV